MANKPAGRPSRHTVLKRAAAGPGGTTEKPIAGNRRLDAARKGVAIEIERTGQPRRLELAVKRLATQKGSKKELRVPQPDMDAAAQASIRAGVPLTVRNLSGTRRRRIRP